MTALAVCGAMSFAAACGDDEEEPAAGGGGETQTEPGQDLQNLQGELRVDGSSTVQPFAQAAAELFQEEAPQVRVTVGGAGTGDGFERFCRGETQVSNASRQIEDDEAAACEKGNITPVEVRVANDALAIVTNPNTEIPNNCITTAQLKRLLRPNSNIDNLSQLGEGFPDQRVQFFTPGEESGTFDYFTDEVLETDAEQRTDRVQTSANDNQLVQGVEGTEGAIGYFGFSFANENRERLKILQVDSGDGCVEPSVQTAQDNTYPLSRPLFMYPSAESLQKPEVRAFMDYVSREYQPIGEASDIVPLTQEQATEAQQKLKQAESGGAAGGGTETGTTTEAG
jgi:phosphate transport system substrate-binding protein